MIDPTQKGLYAAQETVEQIRRDRAGIKEPEPTKEAEEPPSENKYPKNLIDSTEKGLYAAQEKVEEMSRQEAKITSEVNDAFEKASIDTTEAVSTDVQ